MVALAQYTAHGLLRIVYVHTTIPGSCGPLPEHLKASLLQAQRAVNRTAGLSASVVLLSNFKQCRWALDELKNGGDAELKGITTAESMGIKSSTTQEWEKSLRKMIPKGTANEDVLLTSLYRYFMLDDYLVHNNVTGHVLHLDADTMLFADVASLAKKLQAGYPRLGLTPSIHRRFLSASAMYVGSQAALHKMNAFFLSVAANKTTTGLPQYAAWLRGFACCKPVAQGGLLSQDGVEGVRPWAVTDMTLLAFYRSHFHREVRLFPVLPAGLPNTTTTTSAADGTNSVASNGSSAYLGGKLPAAVEHHHLPGSAIHVYSEGGADAGPELGGLLDPANGWGLHLEGQAPNSSSSSLRATDRHAVVEQAVGRFGCRVSFRCTSACVTAPFVTCTAAGGKETPLLALHLSSKTRDKAKLFGSVPCAC